MADLTRAVVVVGDDAWDHDHIDALLSEARIVILAPTLSVGASPSGESASPSLQPRRLRSGELLIDLTERRVRLGAFEVNVTQRELAFLAVLCDEPGRACSFAELDGGGDGRSWRGDTERVHSVIKRLRKKLSAAGAHSKIESIRGYGYRIAAVRG